LEISCTGRGFHYAVAPEVAPVVRDRHAASWHDDGSQCDCGLLDARRGTVPPRARVDSTVGPVLVQTLGWHAALPESLRDSLGRVAVGVGGSAVDAPFVVYYTSSESFVVDHTRRDERKRLFALVAEALGENDPRGGVRLRQGHLTAVRLREEAFDAAEEAASDLAYYPRRPVVLFNHALFADAAIGLDNMRVVKVPNGTFITSPDHVFEPLVLEGGWWLLSHPWPAGGRTEGACISG